MSDQQKFKEYDQMVKRMTPNSQYFQGFWVGGLICVLGQLISMAGEYWLHLDQSGVSMFTSIVLVFLGTTLTGLGIYDRIGCYAGAGSVVPITGFANSVAAPALEFRREGMILGLGAKLFQIAGPVLVYGIGSSVVAGVIYWIIVRWF